MLALLPHSSIRSLVHSLGVVIPLALVACGTSASPGSASGSATDVSREEIVGGTKDTTHSAVVALLLEDPSQSNSFGACSGSVVKVDNGTGYVLTAAHCCGGESSSPNIRPTIVVIANDYGNYIQDLGNTNPAAPAYPVVASSVQYDPAYDGQVHDFCMLQFTGAPASQPTIQLPSANDGVTKGASVEFVGYGVTSGGGNNQNSARYHVTSNVDQSVTSSIIKYSEGQSGQGGPCEGDSGGPALFPAGVSQTQQVVVGVTSYGDPSCSSYGVSSRTSAAIGTNGFITQYLAGTSTGGTPGGSTSGGTGGTTTACGSCQQQATSVGGACYSQIQTCQGNNDCVTLINCLQNCSDDTCSQACASASQAGVSDYTAVTDCLCGTGCGTECATECGNSTGGSTGSSNDGGTSTKTDGGKGSDGGSSSSSGSGSVDDTSGTSSGSTTKKDGGTSGNGATTTTTVSTGGCSVTSAGTSSSGSSNGLALGILGAALVLGSRRRGKNTKH